MDLKTVTSEEKRTVYQQTGIVIQYKFPIDFLDIYILKSKKEDDNKLSGECLVIKCNTRLKVEFSFKECLILYTKGIQILLFSDAINLRKKEKPNIEIYGSVNKYVSIAIGDYDINSSPKEGTVTRKNRELKKGVRIPNELKDELRPFIEEYGWLLPQQELIQEIVGKL